MPIGVLLAQFVLLNGETPIPAERCARNVRRRRQAHGSEDNEPMATVLVTGGSGFIGSHCILHLLAPGHAVRATVRNLSREADVRAMLKEGGADRGDTVTFAAADLSSDAGWSEAVAGCDFVLHVASPFPPTAPSHEDELIVPARDGALRVLRAPPHHPFNTV